MKEISEDILAKYGKKYLNIRNANTPGNIGVILKDGSPSYFLKLNTKKSLNKKMKPQLKDEIDFIKLLNKERIPALEPVKMRGGETIYSTNGVVGYATKWLKSYKKNIKNISEKDITVVAKTIAKMHLAGEKFHPKAERKSWSLKSTKYYLSKNKKILPKEIFIELSSRFFIISLSIHLPRGFIHEDLGKRHFLWKQNKLIGIIDFERAYKGYLICDLAQAVRGWCIEGFQSQNINYIGTFLQEYNKVRRLKENERKYFYQALRFAALERANAYATRYSMSRDVVYLKTYKHFLKQDNSIIKIRSQVEDLLHKLP